MKKSNGEVVIRLKRDFLVSLFLTSLLVLTLLFIGYNFIRGMNLGTETRISNTVGMTAYQEQNMGFYMDIPLGWDLAQTDEATVKSVVQSSSSDGIFDLRKDVLTSEVTPLLLVKGTSTDSTAKQFFSVSLKSREQQPMNELAPIFEAQLESSITGVSDFKIRKSYSDDSVAYIEVTCKTEGIPTLYAQYSRIIGPNVVMGIMGSNEDDLDMETRLKSSIDSIKVLSK